jgi:uncharacterized C2H2 Zn-finger protein
MGEVEYKCPHCGMTTKEPRTKHSSDAVIFHLCKNRKMKTVKLIPNVDGAEQE